MADGQGDRRAKPTQEAIDQSRWLVRASHEHRASSQERLRRSSGALDRARNRLQALVLRRALRRARTDGDGGPSAAGDGRD